jgi:hypothetical protein
MHAIRRRASALAALALAAGAAALPAQGAAAAPAARTARVSLVTILPGKELYSAFGHTAIRVVDERGDRMYNYGLSARPFDLAFALNMLRGNMEFLVAALDTGDSLDFYREVEKRGIAEQVLNLDAARERKLVEALDKTARSRDRFYNYRYFTDNCVTRPAQMLREIAGDSSPPFAGDPAKTLRSSVARELAHRAWLRFATDVLIGPRGDRPMPEGPIFLPDDLMAWAASASIEWPEGKVALAGPAVTLFDAKPYADPPLTPPPLAAFALLLAAAVLFTALRGLRGAPARAFDAALFAAVLVPAVAIVMFWLPARYGEAGWNLNLLWAGPLPLLAAILDRRGRGGRASAWLFRIAAALALLAAAGGGLGLQRIGLEERAIAAALALRCAARGRPRLPRAKAA